MDILKEFDNTLVIVTTRDVRVLITAGMTVGYHLEGMNRNDGRQLFCWHAFGEPFPWSGYEALVEAFVDVCRGLPLSLRVLGRHVRGSTASYWRSELDKASMTLHQEVKKTLRISFDALDSEQKHIFMDIACFFGGHPKSIAERVWEGSGWNAQHALEILKDKCLVEEIPILSLNIQEEIVLRMHDHLRDLGREMALELSPPHPRRLWHPQDLKSLDLAVFKTLLSRTNVRCFSSIFDESVGSQVTFFLSHSDSYLETSASLLWLLLEKNSKEQPSIPSWIPLQNLQFLRIRSGQLKTLWDNSIQAPSQLKELEISQTSLKEFPDFLGISDNLEKVFLDARGLPIQGLSLLESLRMNLCSLCLRSSTLKGKQAFTKRGEKSLCESLVIENFKFNGEMDWNNVKASMSGLEKLEIRDEKFVSKILISGIHYPSLESIKLHCMENLMEVDLTNLTTLNCLNIRDCQKLKRLAATFDLPNLVLLNISECPELKQLSLGHLSCLESITVVDCKHSKSVSGIPDLSNLVESKVTDCTELVAFDFFNSVPGVSHFRTLAQLKINECPGIEELWLGHLSCLEKITIENCNHLKSVSGISNLTKLVELNFYDCEKLECLSLSGMKCLERVTFWRNVGVKYFELDGCQNLKTTEFSCEKLVELSIRGCPELMDIPNSIGPSCLERIIIDGCGKLEYLRLKGCHNLRSVSVSFEIRRLYISDCPELEELLNLATVSCLEVIEIEHCEKIQNIMLPTTLISLSVESCRDLKSVAGTGDLTELTKLYIYECPELEELPNLATLSRMEKIEIKHCEKIQNIMLPTTLISLRVQSCRDLQRVAGTGDLTELTNLDIYECPELEELPSLSRQSFLNVIDISSCEKLQSISGIEELHISRYMGLNYCSNAVIRNCIHKLKRVPSWGMVMTGRAVNGAESTLNECLFSDAVIDIGVDGVIDIGALETGLKWSELSAIIVCLVVVVDSSTWVESINNLLSDYYLEVREGEWIITMVASQGPYYDVCYKGILDVLRRYGIVKKGFWLEVKKGEEWTSVDVLRTIVDRLHNS